MSRSISHIIFYGTLMGADGGRGIIHEPNLTFCGNITLNGLLFNVGVFPALVMGQSPTPPHIYEILGTTNPDGADYEPIESAQWYIDNGYTVNPLYKKHGLVVGELYKINNYESVELRYDGIEGYRGSKDNDLYTRTVVHVFDPKEQKMVDAWVYTWNSSTDGLKLIPSGSWLGRNDG